MSLPLVTRFGADPLLDLEIANKRYVDNSGGSGLTFAKIVKTIDEVRDTDTTLRDDSELFFTPTINNIYHIMVIIDYRSASNADWKYVVTVPSGATAKKWVGNWNPDTDRFADTWTDVSPTVDGVGVAIDSWVQMMGILVMGSTAGDFNFQWGQVTSQATDTTVMAGSLMLVWEQGTT